MPYFVTINPFYITVILSLHLRNSETYLLTPRCRVFLEQPGLQLVKKFPRISRNPKVHYRTHKRPPPVSILDQPNPVHIHTSHLLETRPNIIHPSTPRSPQWSLSLRFPPTKTLFVTPLLTHTRHMPNPSVTYLCIKIIIIIHFFNNIVTIRTTVKTDLPLFVFFCVSDMNLMTPDLDSRNMQHCTIKH